MSVREEISARTSRDVSISAVYTTLERMERKGYVSTRVGTPTAERGGRRKKHYALAAAGQRALQVSYRALREMAAGLDIEVSP